MDRSLPKIAALATPQGASAIAVIRLSGAGTWAALKTLLTPYPENPEPRKLYFCQMGSPEPFDEGFALFFPPEKSYTGEEMAELHCHGSPLTVSRCLKALAQRGFQAAAPGEFTKRRLLHGKADLAQVEGLYQLIYAKTEEAQKRALKMWQGEGSLPLRQLKENLLDCLAQCEVVSDYPEEGIEISSEALQEKLRELALCIQKLQAQATSSDLFTSGVQIAISGPPNVGKSTLFNALCKREKAIVTPFPGTTRDVLEHWLEVEGVPILLRDTAGLHASEDPLETLGISRAKQAIEECHILFWVFSLENPELPDIPLSSDKEIWYLGNKNDLVPSPPPLSVPYHPLSAKTGQGLFRLLAKLKVRLRAEASESTLFFSAWQRELLEKIAQQIAEAEAALAQGVPQDILALLLREALQEISQLTGENPTEEILDQIFSKFCVGK